MKKSTSQEARAEGRRLTKILNEAIQAGRHGHFGLKVHMRGGKIQTCYKIHDETIKPGDASIHDDEPEEEGAGT